MKQERFVRIKNAIENQFRWTLDPTISLNGNRFIVKIFPCSRKKFQPRGHIHALIEILALLKDQLEVEPELWFYDFQFNINLTKELAVLARVKYDALSNNPKPIYFKALEDVPPTEAQLHEIVQKELQKALALKCQEPTLRIKLVSGPEGSLLIKFDGRQQKKVQQNLPKLTNLISSIEDKHILSKWYLDYELNETHNRYREYYKARNDKIRQKYKDYYYLCPNNINSLIAVANKLGCDTTTYTQQMQKQSELRRLGC
jgi:hypothetical protein